MPQHRERRKAIENLENRLAARIVSSSMEMLFSSSNSDGMTTDSNVYDSDDDFLMDGIFTTYNCLKSQRYFVERHHERPNSSRMVNDLLRMNPTRFKARFWMSPMAFARIWNMIRGHNIFTNKSANPQFDPQLQFLVVLFRFGAYGIGASRANTAEAFHISTGVISKFTKRIIVALLSLENTVISWPNDVEKQIIKASIEHSHGFPNVIGIMDGTHVVLARKPSYQGEQYFNRKSRYSISCMIVNDQNCKITHLFAGFPGSAHDSRVFINSQVWLKHTDFFKSDEYLLTDTGYPLTKITLPPYKLPASTRRENRRFNRHLSSIRVRFEHTIGQLKDRFQSLCGMPTLISGKETHTLVVLWICSCVVLHNLLLQDGYDSTWENGIEDPDRIVLDDSSEDANQTLPYNDVFAKNKREIIKLQVLNYHGDM